MMVMMMMMMIVVFVYRERVCNCYIICATFHEEAAISQLFDISLLNCD